MPWNPAPSREVCSAHAEVILSGVAGIMRSGGLLRTRGGDPAHLIEAMSVHLSAPHTRR